MSKVDELTDFGNLTPSSVLRGIVPRLEKVKLFLRMILGAEILMILLVYIPRFVGKMAGSHAPKFLETWNSEEVAVPVIVAISGLMLVMAVYFCKALMRLKKYEPSMGKPGIFGVVVLAITRVGLLFLFMGEPGYDVIFLVFGVLLLISYIRVLRDSMWEMAREVSYRTADRWKELFCNAMITGFITIFTILIVHYLEIDFDVYPARFVEAMTDLDFVLVAITVIVVHCMTLYCLEKTKQVFSRVSDPNDDGDDDNPYARRE